MIILIQVPHLNPDPSQLDDSTGQIVFKWVEATAVGVHIPCEYISYSVGQKAYINSVANLERFHSNMESMGYLVWSQLCAYLSSSHVGCKYRYVVFLFRCVGSRCLGINVRYSNL